MNGKISSRIKVTLAVGAGALFGSVASISAQSNDIKHVCSVLLREANSQHRSGQCPSSANAVSLLQAYQTLRQIHGQDGINDASGALTTVQNTLISSKCSSATSLGRGRIIVIKKTPGVKVEREIPSIALATMYMDEEEKAAFVAKLDTEQQNALTEWSETNKEVANEVKNFVENDIKTIDKATTLKMTPDVYLNDSKTLPNQDVKELNRQSEMVR